MELLRGFIPKNKVSVYSVYNTFKEKNSATPIGKIFLNKKSPPKRASFEF